MSFPKLSKKAPSEKRLQLPDGDLRERRVDFMFGRMMAPVPMRRSNRIPLALR
jgi:hypothetical protein